MAVHTSKSSAGLLSSEAEQNNSEALEKLKTDAAESATAEPTEKQDPQDHQGTESDNLDKRDASPVAESASAQPTEKQDPQDHQGTESDNLDKRDASPVAESSSAQPTEKQDPQDHQGTESGNRDKAGASPTVTDDSSNSSASDSPGKPAAADIDVRKELQALQSELDEISTRNTTRLVTLENNLNRYRKLIAKGEEQLIAHADAMKQALLVKFESNAEHQISLKQLTLDLIKQLESALADGNSLHALPTWDKMQGNISNTSGSIRQELLKLSAAFKPRIAELRDWKVFAATEKKKELIQQMSKLPECRMQPGDRSKLISRLHKRWKELGRSNQNEELWTQFKQLSDRAYEPCKEYFKQCKQLMANNLKVRREICEQLETQLKQFEADVPSASELNKLLNRADEHWKRHAPVEQSRIKPLQKRYYAALNELRKRRREQLKSSAKIKTEIIGKANALLALEDRQQAMTEAKNLQQQWKAAGQSSYREDKRYWEKFRTICDQIFDSKEKGRAKRQADTGQARTELENALKALESLAVLPDEELRQTRTTYQDLQQSFSNTLDSMQPKSRNTFRERFNNIKRKLDTRFKTLPDKKSQVLMQMIKGCLDFLRPLEQQLFSKQAADLESVQKSFDDEQWESLINGEESEFSSLLNQRARLLRSASKIEDFQQHADQASGMLRELCIEAEIRAGSETPEPDQAKRMELQLLQLKHGFGQPQTDRESHIQFVQSSRMKCLCLGPLPEQDQQHYSDRLEKSLQRLL